MKMDYDVRYIASSEKVESTTCNVCSDKMNVRRNHHQDRVDRWSAVCNPPPIYDEFTCSNAQTDWHDQAIALMEFIEETPSAELANIVRKELSAILELRKTTKKINSYKN